MVNTILDRRVRDQKEDGGKNGINYLYKKNGRCVHPVFAVAILKYGWENFEHKIVHTTNSKSECDYTEEYLIKWYKMQGVSYNIIDGTTPAVQKYFSEEERQKAEREYHKKYQDEHREECREHWRNYYYAHKEESAQRRKDKYYNTPVEERQKQHKEHYEKLDKEYVRQKNKEYRESHKEYFAQKARE